MSSFIWSILFWVGIKERSSILNVAGRDTIKGVIIRLLNSYQEQGLDKSGVLSRFLGVILAYYTANIKGKDEKKWIKVKKSVNPLWE